MIKTIGITGPSGAGKSVLSKHLALAGIPCIDADELYHSMLNPPSRCLDALAKAFGSDILKDDGSLDRVALSSRVFNDQEELDRLNNTVLPIVLDEIRRKIRSYDEEGIRFVALDAPTLIESGFHRECDLIVTVLADKKSRITRISERDHIMTDKAKERVAAQQSDDFYSSVSDVVITNDSDEASFKQQADNLIQMILSLK